MRIKPDTVRNLLLVRNDRFGEFLLNIPAFSALKSHFSDSRLTIVVNPYLKELARCIDSADEVIPWENKKRRFGEIIEFSGQLKHKKFDLCVIFNPSKEFNIISFLAGIPIRIGYDRKLGFLLTHKIKDKKHLEYKHEIDYNLELAALAGASSASGVFSLKVDDGLAADLFDRIKVSGQDKFVAVHPWTSDPVKQWPLSNFRMLAKRIAVELNAKVLIIGADQDSRESARLFENLDEKIVNITGKTSLNQLAAVLQRCKLLISGDSGPVHLSCAVKTAVLAIFRNDIPGKTSKRWGPWGQGHLVIEKNNLCAITVDEVFDKTQEALKKGL